MPIKKSSREKTGADRRRFPRVLKNLAIKLKDQSVDFVTETKNLSCIGAYCRINAFVPCLTKLKVTLLLPDTKNHGASRTVTCEATVVRAERVTDTAEASTYDIALYFNKISPSDMKKIDRYVKAHLTESPCSCSALESRP